MSEQMLVQRNSDLDTVIATIGGASIVAVDTEFVRERTFFPELCLIQVAADDLVACVDCLADIHLDALLGALLDDERTWVLHSARQDLEVIWNRLRRLPRRLIDTQIAGSMLGKPPQQSLQAMLAETLTIDLPKDQTRTDWSRRPLTEAALRYALDDVRYLLPAWQALEKQLIEAGRLEWLLEDCARLLETPPVAEPAAVFDRMKGTGRLSADEQAIALALVAWREEEAQRRDRPRRWILSDDAVIEIARAHPQSTDDLRRVVGLPRKLAARSGSDIVAAVVAAAEGSLPPEISRRLEVAQPDRGRVQALQAEVRKLGATLGMAPEVIATRRDLAALAAGRPPDQLREGWRAEVLGQLA